MFTHRNTVLIWKDGWMLSYRDFRIPWNVAGTSRGLPSGRACTRVAVAQLPQLYLVPGEELVPCTCYYNIYDFIHAAGRLESGFVSL